MAANLMLKIPCWKLPIFLLLLSMMMITNYFIEKLIELSLFYRNICADLRHIQTFVIRVVFMRFSNKLLPEKSVNFPKTAV